MPGVAGEPTRHGKGVGPAMYSGHAWEGGQRATFNYGSGVLCIAHRLLLSLFARFALSSGHHSSPQVLRHSRHLNRHSQDILSKMRRDSWDWQSELRIIGTTDFRQIKFDEPTFNYNYLVPTKQCSGLYHLTAHKGSFEEIPPVRIWKLNWEEELNRGGSCVLG